MILGTNAFTVRESHLYLTLVHAVLTDIYGPLLIHRM